MSSTHWGAVPERSRVAAGATGVAAAAGLIAGLTLLARMAGFGRTLVFTDSVRTGGIGSIYNSVNALPNVLYEVTAGGVLAAVAVPVIAGHLGREDHATAHRNASALLTWGLSVLVPLAAVLALLAPVLTGWLLQTSDPGAQQAGTTMLRIFAVQVPFYGVGIVLSGLLQAHRRFFMVALAPLLSSLVVIVSYVVYGAMAGGVTAPASVDHGALLVLAWGTTAGVLALSLPLIGPALGTGWRWTPTWRFPRGDARRAGSLASAGVVALVAQQTCVLVTIWVSNHRGGNGTLSVYQYIQAVYLLPYAVLAVPIATSAFPTLAHAAGAGVDGAATLARSVRAVVLFTALGSAALVAAARPVGTFFSSLDARKGGGRTSSAALASLGDGLAAYAVGLVGFGVVALLTRAVYVRGRPRTAGLAVAGGWLVAAVVPLVVLRDGAGATSTLRTLGWSSSAGMTLSALVLGLVVHRAWGGQALAGVTRACGAAVTGAVSGGLAGHLLAARVAGRGLWGAVGTGSLAAAIAVLVYVGVVLALDRSAARQSLAWLRRRGGRP